MQQGGNVKNVIEIQSVSKGVVNSWVKDQGVGMRMLRCINVKFKVYQNGKVELPYIKCYVYDRNRKLLRTFNRYLELTSSGSMQPAILNVFDGNRTTTIQFVYPETLDFKYAIAVVGNDTNGVFARTLPRNADLNNFSFPEKTLLKK